MVPGAPIAISTPERNPSTTPLLIDPTALTKERTRKSTEKGAQYRRPQEQPDTFLDKTSYKPHSLIDTFHCTGDISRADNEGDRISAGTRCRAVTVDQKNPNRIKIAYQNEAEHQLVKSVAETKIRASVQVLRDELYPIRVDGVKRTAVLDENDKVRAGAAKTFSEKNEITIAKIL
ncbi:hypothetical protein IQ07DRAFT_627151 [Pyrenochaeta sp. DS3sAY3a]|nr:hypothetical protein IQ07DRAFT_627151 [Pyrenochaeta sp. DS3sAY3a]